MKTKSNLVKAALSLLLAADNCVAERRGTCFVQINTWGQEGPEPTNNTYQDPGKPADPTKPVSPEVATTTDAMQNTAQGLQGYSDASQNKTVRAALAAKIKISIFIKYWKHVLSVGKTISNCENIEIGDYILIFNGM